MRRPMDFNRTLPPLPLCFSHAPGNLVRLPVILLENRSHGHLVGKGAECQLHCVPAHQNALRSKASAHTRPSHSNLTERQAAVVGWRQSRDEHCKPITA